MQGRGMAQLSNLERQNSTLVLWYATEEPRTVVHSGGTALSSNVPPSHCDGTQSGASELRRPVPQCSAGALLSYANQS